ncbi:extracellular solute-binding protein [uncultured Roseobacter sp.]|uniref:extracellular solute-binding protein n=1 Tax=uncultured Roseobacter sp. TaxID=114847 RepID=UPI0026119FDB|nr:extracellular solute-binding protein [uncultured Roseobacter sp.]
MLKKLALSVAVAALAAPAIAQDLSSMSWDEIVAQAKEEGEVNWFVWYLQDDFRGAVKAFEEEYGITVNIPEGTQAANNDKLLAERDREAGDIDVMAFSFNQVAVWDLPSLFMPLSDVLPEDVGRTYSLNGSDAGGYGVGYWGNQTGISYDPAKISEEALPQTPEDFAAFWAANPGKFGFNYEKGGSGPSFYQNIFRNLTDVDYESGEQSDEKLAATQPGIDFFNEHAENYVVTASNADSITRVSDGELWMAPGWEDHVAGLQRKGEVRSEIKFYVPAMGMNGGGNAVSIPVNAPNPAAAAVLINWLASPETQTSFNVNFGTAPLNAAADSSNALVPADQRANSRPWPAKPFRDDLEQKFVEDVILER